MENINFDAPHCFFGVYDVWQVKEQGSRIYVSGGKCWPNHTSQTRERQRAIKNFCRNCNYALFSGWDAYHIAYINNIVDSAVNAKYA